MLAVMTTAAEPPSALPSAPSRLAEPDEGISGDELALAGRNHALLLEAMRHDVTPAGLHYVLVHYDVPAVDSATWALSVGGAVATPLSLDVEQLRAYPQVSMPV